MQVADLYHEERLRKRLESSLVVKNILVEHLYHKPRLDLEKITAGLLEDGRRIGRYVCDTTSLLHDALAAGKEILLEGQLGALRDPDHGIYPYPTSSSPLAGFGSIGAGIPPYAITRIIAVTKAYSSCVGAGPFVTELTGAEGDELRLRGGDEGEFGATTGRPRRVGWFDAVATRYGCRVQGATEVAFTVLDALGYLDEIPICVAYEMNGRTVNGFPNPPELESALPVFEVLPGWREDISDVRRFYDLPANAQTYVLRIEELIGVPVKFVSVGSDRQATIVR